MGQVHQFHPTLALMRSVFTAAPEKKICQPGKNLPATQTLRLAQLCMEYEYLVNARLGFAWAIAVDMNPVYHEAPLIH